MICGSPTAHFQRFKRPVRRQRPVFFRVTLHNDDVTRKTRVVSALVKVVSVEDAFFIMEEAHCTGSALVAACDSEDEARRIAGVLTAEGLRATVDRQH